LYTLHAKEKQHKDNTVQHFGSTLSSGGNYVNAITMTGFGTYVPIVQRTTTLRLQWLLMIEWNVVVNMHMDFNGLFLFV